MAKYPRRLLARAKKIKLLLMDVDGVMTDGKFYYVPRPGGGMLETKGFDSRDGLGLRLAHHAGLKTGIITGRGSPVIEYRVKDLGIHFLQQNALEKIEPYERICKAAQVEDAEVCYVGDDLNGSAVAHPRRFGRLRGQRGRSCAQTCPLLHSPCGRQRCRARSD